MYSFAGVLVVAVAISRCDAPQSPPPADSAAPLPVAEAAAQQGMSKTASLLADSTLWGPDFAAALRALPAYESAGEKNVLVFDDRVVGDRRYAVRSAAVATANSIGSHLRTILRAPRQRNRVLESLDMPRRELSAPAPMVLEEDRALHVGNAEPNLQLLAPGLEITAVTSRHGAPDETQTVAIDDGTEARPRILKLHSYDNGAIVFATNTGAVNPAAVERVILDAQQVSAAVK
jgi:hypothetical protein